MTDFMQYLEAHLSPKRYTHCCNVATAAVALARQYGGVSEEKAHFAGLVHDIAKEDPREEQYAYVLKSNMDVCDEEKGAWKVWHAIAGAEKLRDEFGVTDPDVLNAVRYHTVGRGGMSRLEKIVYLADMISAEREYDDVEVMREKAAESLEAGMLYALQYSLQKLVRRAAFIPHHTLDAYHDCLCFFAVQENSEK